MPTTIFFPGDTSLTVEEDASQVQAAFIAGGGSPFRLTYDSRRVWVHPDNIAYWIEHKTAEGSMGVVRG